MDGFFALGALVVIAGIVFFFTRKSDKNSDFSGRNDGGGSGRDDGNKYQK